MVGPDTATAARLKSDGTTEQWKPEQRSIDMMTKIKTLHG